MQEVKKFYFIKIRKIWMLELKWFYLKNKHILLSCSIKLLRGEQKRFVVILASEATIRLSLYIKDTQHLAFGW